MASLFKPGDTARNYAALYGWSLTERVVLVEGEHDLRYFQLASELYQRHTGLILVGRRLSIFPAGIGEDGGVDGVLRHFHPLRMVMDRDLTADGRKVFHGIALFDSDAAGNRGASTLCAKYMRYLLWRDVFLLRRQLPRSSRSAQHLPAMIDAANRDWEGLDCEIEDLVGVSLTTEFLRENPSAVRRHPEIRNGGIHCNLNKDWKSRFIRFVEENALLRDLEIIVDYVKSLRYHVGLPPDGD